MSKTKKYIYLIVTIVLLFGVAYSAYQLEVSNREYVKEKKVRQELAEYKPRLVVDTEDVTEANENDSNEPTEKVVNQSILDLQERNADVVGWITILGTQIDYPFLWADDYSTYLRSDINGERSTAGSIFMDYRCEKNFQGAHSILFGHNMNNGSMFGEIPRFRERTFFLEHQDGYIYLPNENLKLRAIACMVVESSDAEVYGVADTDNQKERFIEVLKEKDIHGGESMPEDLSIKDRFVLLSTCSYEYDEARTVVVYRIVDEGGASE